MIFLYTQPHFQNVQSPYVWNCISNSCSRSALYFKAPLFYIYNANFFGRDCVQFTNDSLFQSDPVPGWLML